VSAEQHRGVQPIGQVDAHVYAANISSGWLNAAPLKRNSLAHGFDPFLVRSVKTVMKMPFDNYFVDWKTDRLPMR
jgi:hypothetical protein